MKTYAEILNDVETLVQDAGIDPSPPSANSVFATAELDALMPFALTRISQFKPWQKKTTKSTVADTRDITLTTGDKWRLLGIEKLEYAVDKDPRKFRGSTRFADVISIKIKARPSSADDIYFFWNKNHILLSATGASSTSGAIKTAAAIGAVSLALDSLGTGTIDEMSSFTIVGDTTVYYVIADATITNNEATVSIWPPLVVAVSGTEVITLAVTNTIEEIPLEGYLARWLAARACISKATKSYSQVNQAIATITLSATAIGDIAAIIDKAEAATTGDIALGRADTVLAGTAVTALAAIIAKAEAATTGDIALGRAETVLADTAITTAETELAKIDEEIVLAAAALASGLSLVNTIPIGGGAQEYMGQASGDLSTAQGRMINGQAYLQKGATYLSNALSHFRAGGLELQTAGAKAQEASANIANATSAFNAAGLELRTASEKANEGIANLRLVATRLQVSQGGLNYERWGRTELDRVETELRAYGGLPQTVRYPED